MINNNISFGKKIPITTCQIQDKKTGKYIPATFYEYDCKDEEDILELVFTGSKWYFVDSIVKNMSEKLKINEMFKTDEKSDLRNHPIIKNNLNKRFFSLQLNDGKILGICQARNKNSSLDIDYIESQNCNHKYIGLNMLASLGIKSLQENKGNVIIGLSTTEARSFYTDKCGFETDNKGNLVLNKPHIKKLIRQTQKETHSKIINLNA